MAEGNDGKRFLGLSGWWSQVANLGIAGVVCFLMLYLVMYQMPEVQSRFHGELAQERQVFREEIGGARQLFRQALQETRDTDREQTKELVKAIDGLTAEVKKLREKGEKDEFVGPLWGNP